MAKLHGNWVWYELLTPDPAGSKAFYDAVVGWRMTPGTAETGGYGFIANPDGGMSGGIVCLTEEMVSKGARRCWLGYIGVDDVDASLKAIIAAGGKELMPARDVAFAGRIAMVADCCGAPFYIMSPNPPPDGGESTAFSATLPGRCGWNEMLAGNQEAALKFYTTQFGWTLPEPMDMGPMGKYQFIDHDGVTVGAIMQAPDGAPQGWYQYFRVASIETAKAMVEASGGKVMNGPMEVPGGDWIVQGIDPQGAMFSLVGGK